MVSPAVAAVIAPEAFIVDTPLSAPMSKIPLAFKSKAPEVTENPFAKVPIPLLVNSSTLLLFVTKRRPLLSVVPRIAVDPNAFPFCSNAFVAPPPPPEINPLWVVVT